MTIRRADVAIGLLVLALAAASPLRAETRSADDAAEAAREAARADRHPESIEAFRRAIEAAPERRREWLLELADQLTWSGRLDEAIGLYREAAESDDPGEQRRARLGLARALSWRGDHASALAEYDLILASDPTEREARLGRARVLSWSNDQGPALAEYEALLRDRPDDLEALRGVGRVQSWRGRQRDAVRRMRQLLEEQPHDREATLILAESLLWMGRADRAEGVLRDQVAADPGDERAASLLEEIEFRQRPAARIDWRESHQSDDLRISLVSLGAPFQFADGRSFVGPRYDLAVYDPGEGPVKEILVQRPGFEAGHRISDSVDWHGSFFVDVIDTRGAAGDHVLPTWDTYLTFWPDDLLRFDVGSSRWTFDSEETLREGLTATQVNASADVLPDELTRATARFSWADYSDGNERLWWQLEVERRVRHEPRIAIGYRYTGFDFTKPDQGGYFNPDFYHSNEAVLRASGWIVDRFRWDFVSSVGYEIVIDGSDQPIWSASGSLAWEIVRGLELEVAYDFFSSRTASAGGFERGTGRMTLRRVF